MAVEEPACSQSLPQLLNLNGCTRETCFITSSLIDPNGLEIAANYYLLTSFPNVGNLKKADVQVNTFSRCEHIFSFYFVYSLTFSFTRSIICRWLE